VEQRSPYRSQVAGLLVNLRRFGFAQPVRAVCRTIRAGALNPSMDDAGALPRRQVRFELDPIRGTTGH
jgi:hypothetical protein